MNPTILHHILRIFGMAFLLMGLLWLGQGLGYIKWPTESFMIDMRLWAWRGAGLAAVGVAMLVLSAQLRR